MYVYMYICTYIVQQCTIILVSIYLCFIIIHLIIKEAK